MKRTDSFVSLLGATLLLHGVAALTACSSGGSTKTTGGTSTGGAASSSTGHGSGGSTAGTGGAGTGGSSTGGASTGGASTGGSTSSGGSDAGGNLCTQTGGTVTKVMCCASVGDFPSTCSIGACSCAPGSSVEVEYCDCPASQCYDPSTGCRTQV